MTATPTSLRMRYPAFAAVPDPTIAFWLNDSLRYVTEAWGEDADPGSEAYAAHQMASNGTPGIVGGDASALGEGVTSFKSASVSITVSETAASQQVAGGWQATSYGRDFAVMLRRNTGGPMLVGMVGCSPC